jgi:hypothetical protein
MCSYVYSHVMLSGNGVFVIIIIDHHFISGEKGSIAQHENYDHQATNEKSVTTLKRNVTERMQVPINTVGAIIIFHIENVTKQFIIG